LTPRRREPTFEIPIYRISRCDRAGSSLSPSFFPLAAGAQNPAAIEHHLRYGVKITEQPDVALELVDRMRSYHVPAVSIAVIDNFRVVFAKGYGVTEFGGSKQVDSTTLFLAGSISKPIFSSGFLRLLNERKDLARHERECAAHDVASAGEPFHRTREGHAAPPVDAYGGTHRLGLSRLRARQSPCRQSPSCSTAYRRPTHRRSATIRRPARGGFTRVAE
jgi:hypothetical protein